MQWVSSLLGSVTLFPGLGFLSPFSSVRISLHYRVLEGIFSHYFHLLVDCLEYHEVKGPFSLLLRNCLPNFLGKYFPKDFSIPGDYILVFELPFGFLSSELKFFLHFRAH